MRPAPTQHIHIQLIGLGEHEIRLHRRNHREAFQETYSERAMRDDLGEREGGGFGVEFALDDLEVWGDGAEVLVGGLVCEVA